MNHLKRSQESGKIPPFPGGFRNGAPGVDGSRPGTLGRGNRSPVTSRSSPTDNGARQAICRAGAPAIRGSEAGTWKPGSIPRTTQPLGANSLAGGRGRLRRAAIGMQPCPGISAPDLLHGGRRRRAKSHPRGLGARCADPCVAVRVASAGLQRGALEARLAHDQHGAGSNPAPATIDANGPLAQGIAELPDPREVGVCPHPALELPERRGRHEVGRLHYCEFCTKTREHRTPLPSGAWLHGSRSGSAPHPAFSPRRSS